MEVVGKVGKDKSIKTGNEDSIINLSLSQLKGPFGVVFGGIELHQIELGDFFEKRRFLEVQINDVRETSPLVFLIFEEKGKLLGGEPICDNFSVVLRENSGKESFQSRVSFEVLEVDHELKGFVL
jgi:hypothetical protein